MCNGETKRGHATGCRIYEAPDGTKGQITYTFDGPVSRAKQDFKDGRKALRIVTSHGKNITRNGVEISERYAGTGESYPLRQTMYLILLRRGGRCFFIESSSPQIAAEIEDWVER